MSTTLERVAHRFADLILKHLGEFDQLGDSRGRESPRAHAGEALGTTLGTKRLAALHPDARTLLGADLAAAVLHRDPFAGAVAGGFVPSYYGGKPYREAEADYGCDEATAHLFRVAGVEPGLFPIKSRVRVLEEFLPATPHGEIVGVSCAFGYGAPWRYHYPMPDGHWLVTDFMVTGRSRAALVELAMTTQCPAWSVES